MNIDSLNLLNQWKDYLQEQKELVIQYVQCLNETEIQVLLNWLTDKNKFTQVDLFLYLSDMAIKQKNKNENE